MSSHVSSPCGDALEVVVSHTARDIDFTSSVGASMCAPDRQICGILVPSLLLGARGDAGGRRGAGCWERRPWSAGSDVLECVLTLRGDLGVRGLFALGFGRGFCGGSDGVVGGRLGLARFGNSLSRFQCNQTEAKRSLNIKCLRSISCKV